MPFGQYGKYPDEATRHAKEPIHQRLEKIKYISAKCQAKRR
jgi:hypothetical protein